MHQASAESRDQETFAAWLAAGAREEDRASIAEAIEAECQLSGVAQYLEYYGWN